MPLINSEKRLIELLAPNANTDVKKILTNVSKVSKEINPWRILNALQFLITETLQKIIEQYEKKAANEILTFLNLFFTDERLTEELIFKTSLNEQDSKIIELNWPYIQAQFWKLFVSKGYFVVNEEENKFITTIFEQATGNEDSERLALDIGQLKAAIGDVNQFVFFCNVFSHLFDDKAKRTLFSAYFLESNLAELENVLFLFDEKLGKGSGLIDCLEDEQKKSLLEKIDAYLAKDKKFKLLKLVLRDIPASISSVLNLIASLSDEERCKILMDNQSDDQAPLVYAIQWRAMAFQPLMNSINALPNKQKLHVFQQADQLFGLNALMIALQKKRMPMVNVILDSMSSLSFAERAMLLRQTNKSYENVLIVAARYFPEAIELILQEIAQLAPQDQAAIFEQNNQYERDALTYALIQRSPTLGLMIERVAPFSSSLCALSSLINYGLNLLINTIDPKDKANLFLPIDRVFDERKETPHVSEMKVRFYRELLLVAIKYEVKQVAPILKMIAALDERYRVFNGAYERGAWNRLLLGVMRESELMLPINGALNLLRQDYQDYIFTLFQEALNKVVMRYPNKIDSLTKVIFYLPREEQAMIFACVQVESGRTILMTALLEKPETVKALMTIGKILNRVEWTYVFKQIDRETGSNVLMQALQMLNDRPKVQKMLIDKFLTLKEKDRNEILEVQNVEGMNALSIAAACCPDRINLLQKKEVVSGQTDSPARFFVKKRDKGDDAAPSNVYSN